MKNKIDMKRLVGFILGIVLLIIISLIPSQPPLGEKAMLALGFLVMAITWMVSGALPDYVSIIAMSVGWIVTGCADMNIVYGTFSTNIWWLLLGALALGLAAAESGLLMRAALYMMKMFPPTFKGQSIALVVIGLVMGPLIPSTAAKAAIIGSVAKSISDAMGFKKFSKGSAGLFASFILGSMVLAPAFLSSSFVGYTCVGLLPEGYTDVNWTTWFLYALPWSIVTIILMTVAILRMYKPKEETTMTKEYVSDELKNLGTWKSKEKFTAIVMIFCLIFWMTERQHGIPSGMVAMSGTVILMGLNVFDRTKFRSKIAWDSIIFIGIIVGLANVFKEVGINDMIRELLGPIISPLMSNIWVFIPVYCLIFFLMRFIIASLVGAITICSIVMVPIGLELGIHPFVIIFIAYTCAHGWFTPYQNSIYITGQVATGDEMASHKQAIPYAVAYMVVTIIGNMVAIPWWKMLGLLP